MTTSAQEAAAALIAAQQAGGTAMGGVAAADAGAQMQAQGAQVTGVDTDELLSFIRDLQGRVQAVEAERAAERAGSKPGIVQLAQLISAHVQGRAEALGGGGFGGTGNVLTPLVKKAADLADAAERAATTGDASEVTALAGALAKGLNRVRHQAASADVSYPLQLLEEDLPETAAGLKRTGTATATVLSRTDAPAPRQLAG